MVQLCAMLHDGQAQARTAHGTAAAFIHAIEPFEDSLLLIGRDTDPRILHRNMDMPLDLRHMYRHTAAFTIVLDGIIAQVVQHLAQHMRHPDDRLTAAGERTYAADVVVLAAGGMGTPAILQQSGIACAQRLFVDPVLCVAAHMPGAGLDRQLPMPFISQQERYILSPYMDWLSFFFNC